MMTPEDRVKRGVDQLMRGVAPVSPDEAFARGQAASSEGADPDAVAGGPGTRPGEERAAHPLGRARSRTRWHLPALAAAVVLVLSVTAVALAQREDDVRVASGQDPAGERAAACQTFGSIYGGGILRPSDMTPRDDPAVRARRDELDGLLDRFQATARRSGDGALASVGDRLREAGSGVLASPDNDPLEFVRRRPEYFKVLPDARAACAAPTDPAVEAAAFAAYQASFDRFTACMQAANAPFLSGPTLKQDEVPPTYWYLVDSRYIGAHDACYEPHRRDLQTSGYLAGRR